MWWMTMVTVKKFVGVCAQQNLPSTTKCFFYRCNFCTVDFFITSIPISIPTIFAFFFLPLFVFSTEHRQMVAFHEYKMNSHTLCDCNNFRFVANRKSLCFISLDCSCVFRMFFFLSSLLWQNTNETSEIRFSVHLSGRNRSTSEQNSIDLHFTNATKFWQKKTSKAIQCSSQIQRHIGFWCGLIKADLQW